MDASMAPDGQGGANGASRKSDGGCDAIGLGGELAPVALILFGVSSRLG
jgi:hypothetical protein